MQRFKKILCVLEHGEASKPALERAIVLAENNQAELMVVDVIPRLPAGIGMPDDGPISQDLRMAMVQEHEKRIEYLIDNYRQHTHIRQKILIGTPCIEIIREVLRSGHDLVVKCPESPNWLDRFFSGDDMHLLRKCPCPVWMVKQQANTPYHRILAAIDVADDYPLNELKTRNELNRMIVDLAGSLAVSEFAQLHIAHVWEAIGESALRHSAFLQRPEYEVNAYVEQVRQHHAQLLDTFIKEVHERLGQNTFDYIKPQIHMPKGIARKEIPEIATRLQIDCVVMGTVARTGVRGLIMGNTAETILEQIDCSVLAVKPAGFLSPVALDD